MYPAMIENYDVPTSVHDALQALAKRGAEFPLRRRRTELDAGDQGSRGIAEEPD